VHAVTMSRIGGLGWDHDGSELLIVRGSNCCMLLNVTAYKGVISSATLSVCLLNVFMVVKEGL